MGTKITKALHSKLETTVGKGTADAFASEFAAWKKTGKHFAFGRDSAYREPKVGVEDYKLRHVHLMPGISQKDIDAWERHWKQGRERKSDHALVYAADDRGNFLLIGILDEPGAHAVARMKTQKHKATMEGYAAIAEAFRHDGSIIA
jgi:hypothetical protein